MCRVTKPAQECHQTGANRVTKPAQTASPNRRRSVTKPAQIPSHKKASPNRRKSFASVVLRVVALRSRCHGRRTGTQHDASFLDVYTQFSGPHASQSFDC